MSVTMGRLAGIVADADTMTEARIDFETPEWTALLEWLGFHGIDPRQIPAGSRISRDECNRCIRYVAIARDQEGRRRQVGFDAPPGEPVGVWVTVPMVEQGEAPPLPYPEVIARCLR